MDNDVLAYRVLLEKRKENAPFWEKKVLTVEEAAEYTGIGRTKIRQIIMRGDCPFAVTNGVQVCVIRDKFIDYLDKQEPMVHTISVGRTPTTKGVMCMPRHLMNCDTKRNKSQKTRAMALRQKLDTQRSMTFMSFGRI